MWRTQTGFSGLVERWTGEEQHWRGEEEELSALSQTTVLVPRYDCYGYSAISWEEADIVWGKNHFQTVRRGEG